MFVQLDYQTQKYLIKNADVLLFKAKKFPRLGWWISKYTNSPYSHSALAYWKNDELYCLEFREFLVSREYPLIEYLKSGYKIDVFRVCQNIEYPVAINTHYEPCVDYRKKYFTLETQYDIIYTAKQLIGKKYGWQNIYTLCKKYIPFARLFCKLHQDDDNLTSFVCSTLVAYCYRQHFLDPVPLLCDSCTTPGDLARSAIFFKLFEIIFDKSETEIV